ALGTAEAGGSRRPSAVAGFMARASFPPSATAGVRMAFEPGRGRTAVPVRTTMFGAALSLFALAAALSFGSSLNRLVTTPALSGWNWDVLVFAGGNNGPSLGATRRLESILTRSRQVQGYAIGAADSIRVGDLGVLGM